MSIVKRNNTYWADFTINGERTRQSLKTQDKKDAAQLHDKIRHEAWAVGVLGEKKEINWGDAVDKYSVGLFNFHYFFDPSLRLHKLTTEIVQKAMQLRAPISQNRIQAKIRAAFNKAAKDGYKVPTINWTFNKEYARSRVITQDELDKIRASLPQKLYYPFEVALHTGLRRSNIINLKWEHIDFDNGTITMPSNEMKNRQALVIPLTAYVINLLDWAKGNSVGEYAFTRDGLSTQKLKTLTPKAWYRAINEAGCPDIHWHDLRRTWATRLREKGVPRETIKALGGWKSDKMLGIYERYSGSMKAMRKAVL